jgi:hypothetical protein
MIPARGSFTVNTTTLHRTHAFCLAYPYSSSVLLLVMESDSHTLVAMEKEEKKVWPFVSS